ncbi:MAG: hypothetical protein FWG25_09855 [Promicromonosporaceae bacterium]|nr:hypothetical protein [Promicromonosporaceae bacterium]
MTGYGAGKPKVRALSLGVLLTLSMALGACGAEPVADAGAGVVDGNGSAPEFPTSGQVFTASELVSTDCNWDGMQITGIRVGRHEGFDRVVFDLDGDALPCYRVGFDADPAQDGSGLPVDLGNFGALRVEIPQLGPEFPELDSGFTVDLDGPAVAFGRFDTFFEGTVTAFIATVDTIAPEFAVSTYPGRLVVDVKTD